MPRAPQVYNHVSSIIPQAGRIPIPGIMVGISQGKGYGQRQQVYPLEGQQLQTPLSACWEPGCNFQVLWLFVNSFSVGVLCQGNRRAPAFFEADRGLVIQHCVQNPPPAPQPAGWTLEHHWVLPPNPREQNNPQTQKAFSGIPASG